MYDREENGEGFKRNGGYRKRLVQGQEEWGLVRGQASWEKLDTHLRQEGANCRNRKNSKTARKREWSVAA